MGAIGGDIISVSYNHATIGSAIFYPKAGEDSTFDLGGFRNDDSDDGVDGSGATIQKKNRKRWSFEVPLAWDNITRKELEAITLLAASTTEAQWTISCASGAVYKGTGMPVGDLKANGNAASFPLKVAGGGILKKIV